MTLTDRQGEILEFIRSRVEGGGGSPSLREIMEHFGFGSPATVSDHLAALEKKGAIRREPRRARNILLVEESAGKSRMAGLGSGFFEIPLYGMIPAGWPEGSEPEPERCISIDPDSIRLPRNARTFALQVRGDSMVGAGILDKDVVILELAEPRNRDIVAALIDGETTLKRYLIQNGRPFLRAENPAYPDLIPARELVIQGVLRALVRTI
ncbi:MAG: transcriptional repressor LexA [Terrimicrobiaceae bacterium]